MAEHEVIAALKLDHRAGDRLLRCGVKETADADGMHEWKLIEFAGLQSAAVEIAHGRAESINAAKAAAIAARDSAAAHLRILAVRMQHRVDAMIERDGSREAAVTGNGVSISLLFSEDLTKALVRAADKIEELENQMDDRESYAADRALY